MHRAMTQAGILTFPPSASANFWFTSIFWQILAVEGGEPNGVPKLTKDVALSDVVLANADASNLAASATEAEWGQFQMLCTSSLS